MSAVIHTGDCREVMCSLEAESFDAIATDPPYGIRFRGAGWDHKVPGPEYWSAALRVAKPSARLVACGIPRTGHRLTCAIEDAGWIIEDTLAWLFGQGMPKHTSKLKPAYEPIVLARAPGPILDLNADACRLGPRERTDYGLANAVRSRGVAFGAPTKSADFDASKGRWPANVVLGCACETEHEPSCAVAMLDEATADLETHGGSITPDMAAIGYGGGGRGSAREVISDAGGASRFFYVAKASRAERERWLREAAEGRTNKHPTVKPLALMRWLLRLVTPPGGRVLDPFCGSGTTCAAAVLEGFDADGIDLDPAHCELARARVLGAHEESGTLAPEMVAPALSAEGPKQLGLLGGAL